jgi:hypothetical protein
MATMRIFRNYFRFGGNNKKMGNLIWKWNLNMRADYMSQFVRQRVQTR